MDIEERKKKAITRQFKAVFPNTTNNYDTLFGGTAMQWMDEVAFICATRFSRKKVVTVSTSKVDFNTPIPAGTFVELVAFISRIGQKSVDVTIDIYIEQMYDESRVKAIEGVLTFVAVGEDMKPIKVLD